MQHAHFAHNSLRNKFADVAGIKRKQIFYFLYGLNLLGAVDKRCECMAIMKCGCGYENDAWKYVRISARQIPALYSCLHLETQ